jgi:glycosyltransferase involved in cell wall biosynthesis
MFVSAISRICSEIDIVHFAPPGHWSLDCSPAELSKIQSSYWGVNVDAVVSPIEAVEPSKYNHLRSIFDASFQGHFSGFGGHRQILAALHRNPQYLFVHRLTAMLSVFRIEEKLPPIFFDVDDVEHWSAARAALDSSSAARKPIRLLHVPALFAAEYRAAKLAYKTSVCSELDKSYLQRLGFGRGVICVPNAIEIPARIAPTSKQPTILLLGPLTWPPNADAADRLISRIWPRVRAQVPSARLVIAGASPQSIRSFSSNPIGVEFPGIVPDLEQLYSESRIVCCPLTRGGGTRMKLVEAAAYGKAMVSTAMGAEGLAFRPETEILIRDEDDALASACVRLLRDDELCSRIGNAARKKAESVYDFNKTRDLIQAHFLEKSFRQAG